MTDMTESELAVAWNPRPAPRYEYKIDGVSEWRPTAETSPRWVEAIEASLDLLTVSEVAFTVGDPDVSTVVIRYRRATA